MAPRIGPFSPPSPPPRPSPRPAGTLGEIAALERERAALQKQLLNPFDPASAFAAVKKLELVEAKLHQLQTKPSPAQPVLDTSTSGFLTPVGPRPQPPQVAQAVERFKAAKTASEAAVVLQREFQLHPDAQFQAALWQEAKGRLPELVKAQDLPTMRALVAIAEHGGVDVERDIAAALARNAPEALVSTYAPAYAAADAFLSGPVAHLRQAISETGRLDLAQRFVEALHAAGKPQAASGVASAVASTLGALRADFEAQQKKIDGLNARLGLLVAGFGPMMTDAQKQSAIQVFKARHVDDYRAYEAAGKKLAQSLAVVGEVAQGGAKTEGEKALQKQAQGVIKKAGALADTRAGEAELKAAMDREALGQTTWLSQAMAVAQRAKDGEKIASTLGTAIFRTLALDAAKLAESNLPLAMEKMAGLARYAKAMGIDPAKAEALGNAMAGMLKGGDSAGKALEKAVLDIEGTPLVPPDGHLSKALKGVGLALSVYSLGKSGLGDDALEKVKNITTGLNVGADAVALGLSIVGRGEALKGLAEGASKRLGVLSGAFDLATGIRSLAKGEFAEAGTSFASSAGALLMLTPGGQIPGALLTVGSIISGWIFASRKANAAEAADEADAKAFLQAAGLHEEIASPLADLLQKNRRNVGPFLTQLEAHLGLKQGELLKRLNKPELADKVRALVVILKDIEPGKDGLYPRRTPMDELHRKSGYQHVQAGGIELDYRPKSLEAVTEWMRQQRLLGG
ncbi:MAG: hypothetical protein AB1938_14530 [Myxococcota bacterium]